MFSKFYYSCNFFYISSKIRENQPLLHNAYVGFLEEGDPSYLGVAMENSHWLSKLMFSWVNPMMDKGFAGKLKNAEDLYDVPDNLDCKYISAKLELYFDKRDSQETGKCKLKK